jgi:hypothetical protein
MTPPLDTDQTARLRELRATSDGEGLDPHQRLRLACLQIVGRLGVRCDPRAAAEDLFDYVINGRPEGDASDHNENPTEAA